MNVLIDANVALDVIFEREPWLRDSKGVWERLAAIVTRNPRGFAGSPIPVLAPAELLGLLAKAPDA